MPPFLWNIKDPGRLLFKRHHFFKIVKIWVGCCLNATNFWACIGLCYSWTLLTQQKNHDTGNIHPNQIHTGTNIFQNARPHWVRGSSLYHHKDTYIHHHQLKSSFHKTKANPNSDNSLQQLWNHILTNTTKTWFIISLTTLWLRKISQFLRKAYALFLTPPKLSNKKYINPGASFKNACWNNTFSI